MSRSIISLFNIIVKLHFHLKLNVVHIVKLVQLSQIVLLEQIKNGISNFRKKIINKIQQLILIAFTN